VHGSGIARLGAAGRHIRVVIRCCAWRIERVIASIIPDSFSINRMAAGVSGRQGDVHNLEGRFNERQARIDGLQRAARELELDISESRSSIKECERSSNAVKQGT
jgi:hypothetical protein